MDPQTIWEKIKDCITYIAFKIFLWSIDMSKEKYWEEIYKQEKGLRRNHE